MTNLTLRYLRTKLPAGVSEDPVHSERESAEKTHKLNMSICQIDLRPLGKRDTCLSSRLVGNAFGNNGGVVQTACGVKMCAQIFVPFLGGKQTCCIGSVWEQTAAALSAVIVEQTVVRQTIGR